MHSVDLGVGPSGLLRRNHVRSRRNYTESLANVGNSSHVGFTLITTEELVHLLNADALRFRHSEVHPYKQEDAECCQDVSFEQNIL